ncbi:hypothetical protein Ani05nite_07770 [Amorphoplanes nipponensis]|uniref:GGDEF domain-containing protein n=2 Tax=Actinoplanes nipponensis TaxID=135950 RepID=A0A919JCE2_9ACTN|nr:GGDEF domain-containing protein [Actinoplanes nipponensis]GIE47243.1 hypothetical protein Ani05nite_07770 [Actinoplanes nipponensis]
MLDNAEVMRLVAAAHEGDPEDVRRTVEARMIGLSGSVEDGPAGLHYVRTVAFRAAGAHREALAACTLMVAAADREQSPGWRANALALRAMLRIVLGDSDLGEHDVDGVLRDLTEAEAAAADSADPMVVSSAHNVIAIGYYTLRLYELADPHYTTAYELMTQLAPAGSALVTFQVNLAELHLAWALELYRVGRLAEAEEHSAVALSHGLLAGQLAPTDSPYWRDVAGLYVGCAQADGDDPAAAAELIRRHAEPLRAGRYLDWWRFSVPFLAVALARSGRRAEAVALVEQVLAELPADIEWYNVAALTHTHAILLSADGPADLRVALRYGDCLAAALWRQRLQTLHAVRTMRSLQQLRVEHELVARSADTDALTGVPNRRAYDRELVRRAGGAAGVEHTAVLVVDLDRFKALNDGQGHAAGDRALTAIAAALAAETRAGDVLARIGGDEFCVLLDAVDDRAAAEVAERMVRRVRALGLTVTASIGVASGPAGALSDTLAGADHAMYAAKAAGGDRIHWAAAAAV